MHHLAISFLKTHCLMIFWGWWVFRFCLCFWICVHPSTLSPLTTYSICEARWPSPWDSDNTQSVLSNPQIYKYIQNLSVRGISRDFQQNLRWIFAPNICPNWLVDNYYRQRECPQKCQQLKCSKFYQLLWRIHAFSMDIAQMYPCKIFFLKCILANLFFRCIRTRCISWNLFLQIHSSLVKCGSWIPWVKLSWGSI